MLVGVVFAGLFCGVGANALFMQTARHPAPLFRGPVIAPRAVAPRERAPTIQEKEKEKEKPAAAMAPVAVPIPPQRPADVAARDQIGSLLSGGPAHPAAPAAPAAAAPAAATDSSPRVLAAQKALVKLGYVLKPDGVMGVGTRKAIEMFEAAHKLPTTGELTSRVVRELATQSGVAVP